MYYHGLTMPEEAALFRALNDRRAVKKIDDFRISVTAGVESSRDIVGIVQAIGLTISDQMRDGHIVAVSALEHVYSGGRVAGPREGRLALEKALKTILSAWGNQSSGFNGEIIKGVGLVYLRYGRKIEQEVMSAKLAPCTGGAPGLLGKARSMREIRGRQLHHCVAAIVVDIYNKGRRANKLDDWE
jgi:hypothetical protein